MIGTEYAVMIFVGIMWGITNALMETSAREFNKETIQSKNSITYNIGSGRFSFLYDFIYLASDWKFIIPFGINQFCSIGYNFVLAKVGKYHQTIMCLEISIATTVVN